jgi:hypothetical protein
MFMPGRIKGSVAHADARLQASVVVRMEPKCARKRSLRIGTTREILPARERQDNACGIKAL